MGRTITSAILLTLVLAACVYTVPCDKDCIHCVKKDDSGNKCRLCHNAKPLDDGNCNKSGALATCISYVSGGCAQCANDHYGTRASKTGVFATCMPRGAASKMKTELSDNCLVAAEETVSGATTVRCLTCKKEWYVPLNATKCIAVVNEKKVTNCDIYGEDQGCQLCIQGQTLDITNPSTFKCVAIKTVSAPLGCLVVDGSSCVSCAFSSGWYMISFTDDGNKVTCK